MCTTVTKLFDWSNSDSGTILFGFIDYACFAVQNIIISWYFNSRKPYLDGSVLRVAHGDLIICAEHGRKRARANGIGKRYRRVGSGPCSTSSDCMRMASALNKSREIEIRRASVYRQWSTFVDLGRCQTIRTEITPSQGPPAASRGKKQNIKIFQRPQE